MCEEHWNAPSKAVTRSAPLAMREASCASARDTARKSHSAHPPPSLHGARVENHWAVSSTPRVAPALLWQSRTGSTAAVQRQDTVVRTHAARTEHGLDDRSVAAAHPSANGDAFVKAGGDSCQGLVKGRPCKHHHRRLTFFPDPGAETRRQVYEHTKKKKNACKCAGSPTCWNPCRPARKVSNLN